MIATVILLYLILIYVFEMEREMVYKLLLIYSVLSLLPLLALLLIYGFDHPVSAILPILIGL